MVFYFQQNITLNFPSGFPPFMCLVRPWIIQKLTINALCLTEKTMQLSALFSACELLSYNISAQQQRLYTVCFAPNKNSVSHKLRICAPIDYT